MAITKSTNGAVVKGVQGDTIVGRYWKALFWVLSSATVNTHLCEITETDTSGHQVYVDAAPKTDGAVPIPCPEGAVESLFIKDLDNGFILAYPKKNR